MKSSLRPFLSRRQIEDRLKEVAAVVSRDYAGKRLVLVMVLEGAICLTADLIRMLTVPFTLESIHCSSYPVGTKRQPLEVFGLERLDLAGKDVLIVDDLFDSGATMNFLSSAFKEKKARSVEGLALLKKKIDRTCLFNPKYVLFEMGDEFVVGYGVDYNEQYRGLEDLFILEGIT